MKDSDFKSAQLFLFGDGLWWKGQGQAGSDYCTEEHNKPTCQQIKAVGFSAKPPLQEQLRPSGWQTPQLWLWKIKEKEGTGNNKRLALEQFNTTCVNLIKCVNPTPELIQAQKPKHVDRSNRPDNQQSKIGWKTFPTENS